MSDECMELKNIKYQTMLLNNNSKIFETKPNVSNIEKFLQKETKNDKNKPWSKLNKGMKINLLQKYVDEYSSKENLTDEQKIQLMDYLKLCLERKKLNKKNDIVYDKEKQQILKVNNLTYNKSKMRFTIKKNDKKVSSLKSLAPKNKTKRKKKSRDKGKKKSKAIKEGNDSKKK